MKVKQVPISEVQSNPDNPRTISKAKLAQLKQSIEEFPKMLKLRPIVVDANMQVLGGNMRLEALRQLGHKQVPVVIADELTEAEKREFIIKDNVGFGEWDWESLHADWDMQELESWGMKLEGWELDPEDMTDGFDLPDGDKQPYQQKTFTLADEQAATIENAIHNMKQSDLYKYGETFGNENSNGNALYFIITEWERLRTSE